jgi:hypothetical protein
MPIKLKTALRALLRRAQVERELDEELRYHIDRQTDQNIRLGMNPEEARYAARKAFGGMEQAKERSRDARGARWVEDLWQDLRYGSRMLMKQPSFTLIAVITLALGIGANTAVFSLVDAFMLRQLPAPDPERLVFVRAISPEGRMTGSFPYGVFEQFRVGAGRGRIVRQLLTESVLLALLAGAMGLLLAHWLVGIFLKVLPFEGDDTTAFNVDLRILAFTGAVSLLVGVFFGLVPALMATRIDLNKMLKGAEGHTTSRGARRRLAKSLVIAQVALSLALLLGAGLMIRSLRQVYAVDIGFDRDKALYMWVYPTLLGYDHEREMRLYNGLLERFRAQPGVASASLSRYELRATANLVGPGFFETLGLGLAKGREFSAADTATAPKVAIINEVTAQKYFPNMNPVGQPDSRTTQSRRGSHRCGGADFAWKRDDQF